jgi:SNF2 family DNA or RNA helicase
VLAESRDATSFALFWEMGTGKTKLTLDTIAHLRSEGRIDAVVVVAPNGVHRNWIEDEIPKWFTLDVQPYAWLSGKAGSQRHARAVDSLLVASFPFLAFSYEGLVTERAVKYLRKFFEKRRVFMVLDESTRIKTPAAKRTIKIVAAGRHAAYRRILTGTPVTNSPFDVYSQMKFLDPDFWKQRGFSTLAEFRNHFGIFKTMENDRGQHWEQVVAFRNLSQLQALLAPVSSRVLKEDALDLPPKLYTKRYFDLSPEQIRVYREIRDEALTLLNSGELVTAALAITRLLRLQQVTSNYLPVDDLGDGDQHMVSISDHNPRLDCLLELLEEIGGQAIIWARFRRDIDQITEALTKAGRSCARYDGKVGSDGRVAAKNAFQKGDVQFFVSNPAVGATGLTLTAARTVIYYNNSFKLEDRLQSEDRAHRIGQHHPVQYIDIVAPGTVDTHIVAALRNKINLASAVTGDQLKEWI